MAPFALDLFFLFVMQCSTLGRNWCGMFLVQVSLPQSTAVRATLVPLHHSTKSGGGGDGETSKRPLECFRRWRELDMRVTRVHVTS